MSNTYRKSNPAYFDELVELCNKTHGHGLAGFLNHSKKYLKEWIESNLPLLQDKVYNISTKCYWIVNGIEDFPKCEFCHKKDNYIGKNVKLNGGYNKTCSVNCGHKLQGKTVSEILRNMPQSEKNSIVEKRKQTCIERYGVDNPLKCKTILQKSKTTHVEKNNGSYFSNASISKMKSTKLKKYGNLNNYSKIRNTVLERYGVENIGQHKETRSKVRNTCIERYGAECAFKSKQIQEKIKQTCIERYGTDNVLKLSKFHEKARLAKKTDSYNRFILNCEYDEPMFTLEEYLRRKSDCDLLEFRCKKCGKTFKAVHEDGMHKHCEYCYHSLISQLTSEKEKQLISFIESECNLLVLKNSKSIIPPLELDAYVSEKKIAFEFDGLYWHNEKNKPDKNYHLHKTEECEKKGIQLIHIFENEWIFKQDIVKSRIKNLFGIYDKTVFARKCEVREVDSKNSKKFQEDNHIQGSVNQKVSLGLYSDNKLISLMTFGKCRFDKKHEWEMLRFCNKLGHHVPGAASKLLKHFERDYKPKSLVSYADRRWSQGKVYRMLGFKLDHISKPDYWYVIGNQLKSRVNFQKHKLSKILKLYDSNMTEVENMCANGYYRIFDCGNIVFEKIY